MSNSNDEYCTLRTLKNHSLSWEEGKGQKRIQSKEVRLKEVGQCTRSRQVSLLLRI